ncbi:nuclear transport factor 2 family protein [Paludisphaera soli]|uniref:nuclear transport factor 2 family protein n=1 Tax=Paludisphaera soli TaxID=2712865 RepID=UPI0013ECA87E|nr:nuclear transport factor 2 family protein [Paludisphaera soli]
MTFRETLTLHLQAIQGRDLGALMGTVSPDNMTLITPKGRVIRTPAEFARIHQAWFASPAWTLDVSMLSVIESPTLGVATLVLDYREDQEEGPAVHRQSLLTLVLALRGGLWEIVLDQSTAVQKDEAGDAEA